jgi:hypothetical protein
MRTFSIRTYAPLLVTFVIMLAPLIALGATTGIPIAPGGGTTGIVTSPGGGTVGKIDNPIKASNFCQLIKILLDAILIIGMPIAVVFLVWVGFKFILAQGNPEKIKEAQKNFLNTVIGIAIFIGAWTIAKVIASTLQGLGVSAVNECVR